MGAPRWGLALAVLAAAGMAAGCSKGGTTGTGNNYTISLALGSSSGSIAPGSSSQFSVTISRGGGYSADVAVAVTGAPTGVTTSVSSLQTNGTTTTGTVTLTVGASVAAGSYPLTVQATGSGVSDATQTFTLTVTAAGAASINVSAEAVTVTQGTSGASTITVSRSNFTGTVTLAAENVPSGVTVTFNPVTLTGTTSTATVVVPSALAVGNYSITVRATGTGVSDATATIALTVSAAAGFTLSPSAATLSVAQGANGTSTINITRVGGFSSAVAFSASGLPSGVTASFNPTSASGNSTVLTLTAASNAAAGTYTVTVSGTYSALSAQTTIALTVTSSGGGGNTLTLDYSLCDASQQPIWVAYKDGTGPWTVATGTNHVYHITVASNIGGYAAVTTDGTTYSTDVAFGTNSDLTLVPRTFCTTVTGGHTVNFTVTGLTPQTGIANLGLGGSSTSALALQPNGAFTNVPSGTFDLIGYAQSAALAISSNDRGYVQRGITVSGDMNLGSIVFGGSHSFAPMAATISITNKSGTENATAYLGYLTGAACHESIMWSYVNAPASFTGYGFPSAQQIAGEYHTLGVVATSPTSSRTDVESFHAFGNRNVTLPALLAGVNVVRSGSAYAAESATFTTPADITNPFVSLSYDDATTFNQVSVSATASYLATAGNSVAMPDLSAVSGFTASWEPMVGNGINWDLSASSLSNALGECAEGATYRSTSSSGSN